MLSAHPCKARHQVIHDDALNNGCSTQWQHSFKQSVWLKPLRICCRNLNASGCVSYACFKIFYLDIIYRAYRKKDLSSWHLALLIFQCHCLIVSIRPIIISFCDITLRSRSKKMSSIIAIIFTASSWSSFRAKALVSFLCEFLMSVSVFGYLGVCFEGRRCAFIEREREIWCWEE